MSEKKTIEVKDTEERIEMEKNVHEDEEKSAAIEIDEEKVEKADTAEDIGVRLEAAEKEAEAAYDRFLRVSADLENCKKRHLRDISEFRKFANQSLIKDLLPIIDNLERAIISTEKETAENQCIVEGVELTHKEILKVLERYGVQPVESIWKPFDPNYHEAVSQQPSEEHPDNTVLQELQKGYLLHDRLIRPAMVLVSASGTRKDDTEDDDPQASLSDDTGQE